MYRWFVCIFLCQTVKLPVNSVHCDCVKHTGSGWTLWTKQLFICEAFTALTVMNALAVDSFFTSPASLSPPMCMGM